jgi:hypothetical protein
VKTGGSQCCRSAHYDMETRVAVLHCSLCALGACVRVDDDGDDGGDVSFMKVLIVCRVD